MARTEEVYLKGKTKWFRHDNPNQWGKWAHVLYPDQPGLEKLRELQAQGAKNIMRKDEDGYFINISRPTSLTVRGKVVGMEPPIVVLADGMTPLQGMRVGNGSDVTTKIEVYEHRIPSSDKKAKAFRWKSSRIDNLVPFESTKDFNDEQKEMVSGLADQPKPQF